MNNLILLIILIFTAIGCQSKSRDKDTDNKENISFKNDSTMERNYERFDFEAAEKNRTRWGSIEMERKDTLRTMFKSEKILVYTDYLPASEFYEIVKFFHQNGAIKSQATFLGSVRFGIYEEYDENGYCIKKVDEDRKFGKIKREDIVKFMEKEGWFNRTTGENKVAKESPLKTDGTFYREIMRYTSIGFIEAKYDTSGKEIEPLKWRVVIEPRFERHVIDYTINGNTGKIEKREYYKIKTK